MEESRITRRAFLKASAVTGATAAVFLPKMGALKALTKSSKPVAAEEKVVHSGCRACHVNCPVLVHVRDGRVVKVEGDITRGPPNFGRVCLRSMGAIQWLYSPTRIKYPLKRVGKRGEGKWERISWDQAMDEVGSKLKEITEKYGAEAIGLPGRTGRHDLNMMENRLAYSLNTPNKHWGSGEDCWVIRHCVSYCTFGTEKPNAETGASAIRVNWGLERSINHTTLVQHDVDARFDRGQKVIAIDPVYTATAAYSDLWLPIRPGADGAMMLAWINIIISENLYDTEFLKTWTNAPFLATCEETSYKVGAFTNLTTGESSFPEAKQNLGNLVTEADILEGGSPSRYLFWDESSGELKYWDVDEIAWEGGPSGKAHYNTMAEKCGVGPPFQTPTYDVSPAAEIPAGIDPALFGTYTVTLKDGKQIECKPVFQHLADIAAEYTPEKAEEITWCPKEKIIEAARMYATIKPASIDEGVCLDQHVNSSQIIHCDYVLQMMTGNVDKQGGNRIPIFYPVTPMVMETETQEMKFADLPMEQREKLLGYYDHPVYCGGVLDEDIAKLLPYPWSHGTAPSGVLDNVVITDAHCALVLGKPYPLKAYVTLGSNPMMHDANVNYLYEGLQKLEHHVAIDIVMTPTCEMADYVFPAVTWFERPYLSGGGSTYVVRAYDKSIEPLWESKHDWEFSRMIAERMGRGEDWNEGEKQEDWYDFRLRRDLGISWEDLLARDGLTWTPPYPPPPAYEKYKLAGKFNTYTGKAEIYSTIFKKWGFPPIPVHAEVGYTPYGQPEMMKEYPLVLSTGKSQPGWFHSEFRMVPWLREVTREPWLFINPSDAIPLDIEDRDWVWIETEAGRCMNKAVFNEGLIPGVVVNSQHAWWRPEKSAEDELHGAFEWNIGCVCAEEFHNPESGSSPLKAQLCKVYKASPEDIEKYEPEITLEQLKALMPLEEV